MKKKRTNNAPAGISIRDFTGKSGKWVPHLRKALRTSFVELGLQKKHVSLSLIGNPKMRKLNYKYRGINRPTDVLSFSQEAFVADRQELGDIIIASPTARRQAKEAGKKETDEVAMLAIHGLLHLLGYDHANPKDAKKMFSLQNRLLKKVT